MEYVSVQGVEVPALGLRVSYAGEFGWEFHTGSEYGEKLWETLHAAAADHDMVPMGTDALNSLRIEKGFRLYGADIRSEYDPYEAGLGFAVDLDTGFVGSEALRGADDPDRRLTPLTLDEPGEVIVGGMPIVDDGDPIAYVTSTDYGYSVDRCIAYGYLPTEYADPGTELAIRYEDEPYPATVRSDPVFEDR